MPPRLLIYVIIILNQNHKGVKYISLKYIKVFDVKYENVPLMGGKERQESNLDNRYITYILILEVTVKYLQDKYKLSYFDADEQFTKNRISDKKVEKQWNSSIWKQMQQREAWMEKVGQKQNKAPRKKSACC